MAKEIQLSKHFACAKKNNEHQDLIVHISRKEFSVSCVREPTTEEVSCSATLVKQRTERIGIGVIFERKPSVEKQDTVEDENVTLVDVMEMANIKQDDGKKKKKKKRLSRRDKVEIKVTPSDESDSSVIQRSVAKKEMLEVNVSRKRTLSGTRFKWLRD
ncbi:hypothetical protein OESDEN_10063 [Oesophagostomum dentatum]|uniref:Uncharacterized protein n=1 Tax=Oesophagostomum dentatum TaxID=61180 RepID=A0A0B1T2U8_OESDE|nr:hypothetical protein OESDEN_10063 [Oesophagostomum dentatum]